MRDGLRRALLDFFAAEVCGCAGCCWFSMTCLWGDELTVSLLDEVLRQRQNTALCTVVRAARGSRPSPETVAEPRVNRNSAQGLDKKACEQLIVRVLGKDVPPQAIAQAVEQCAGNALF